MLHLRKCHHKDPMGVKRKNMSGPLLPILKQIDKELFKYNEELRKGINSVDEIRKQEIICVLDEKQKRIQLLEKAIERIDDAYESGIYSKEKYRLRIRKAETSLYQAKEQARLLQSELAIIVDRDPANRLNELMTFLERIHGVESTYEEQNELYKTIIKSIIYTRTEYERIDIKINFK